jgi:putative transposase
MKRTTTFKNTSFLNNSMRLTIRCGIVLPTKRKQMLLEKEYTNLQLFLKGKDVPLYSANKQQALRFYKKIKRKEYPLSLRNDLIDVQKSKCFYFLKIPVAGVKGGIRLPFKPHREIPANGKLCESKLFKKNGKFFVNLTYDIPTAIRTNISSVLAVDMGERTPATAVLLQDGAVMKPMFLGREIRGIRRHYAWLRMRLQKKGLLKIVKRIGDVESRKINEVLHRISKRIVNVAASANSCIVLGRLHNIRKSARNKGRRFNRIVSSMPFFKLQSMIEYKAAQAGVPVLLTPEDMTSSTCHICGLEGKRITQGCFFCKNCGQYNADLNGAINIGKRLLPYIGESGATCGLALNCGMTTNHGLTTEATRFSGW